MSGQRYRYLATRSSVFPLEGESSTESLDPGPSADNAHDAGVCPDSGSELLHFPNPACDEHPGQADVVKLFGVLGKKHYTLLIVASTSLVLWGNTKPLA